MMCTFFQECLMGKQQKQQKQQKDMLIRLEECKNIRMQMQSLGILSDPLIHKKVRDAMNAFITGPDPVGSVTKIPLFASFSDTVSGSEHVIMTLSLTQQSGLVLMK